jgi:hypothetical protein
MIQELLHTAIAALPAALILIVGYFIFRSRYRDTTTPVWASLTLFLLAAAALLLAPTIIELL